jgi:hypothetical protein
MAPVGMRIYLKFRASELPRQGWPLMLSDGQPRCHFGKDHAVRLSEEADNDKRD